jgi:predicted TIM-barrel fold metal-dependent hydrolase
MTRAVAFALPFLLLAAVASRTEPQQEAQAKPEAVVKFGVPVRQGPMDAILLKDYKPASSLIVPVTPIQKARFPVIDAHAHSSMGNIKTRADVDAWVKTMDEVGVELSVVFTNASGAEFDRQAELFLGSYPKRFQVWYSFDASDPDAPDFASKTVAELERVFKKGARGVGEITDKGWGVEASESNALPRARRLRFDDPRLDPFWKRCGELNMPVNIHIADHPSCWKPLDTHQERTPDFQNFNLSAKDVPSYEELLSMRERLLAKHPKTKFIFCHFSNQGNDTASLARMLDRFPNMYVDMSARDYEIGRQPRTMKAFLEKYRARVLYGTDMGRDKAMYEGWWRLLETADEYMPGRIWWPYYGLELSESALKSIYRDTALKVLNLK